MGAEQLPLAGVEAIVEGLSQFQGDIGKMNSSLDSLQPRTTLLQKAFSGAWDMIKGFGEEVLHVAEYALGHLLADAVEWVVQKIGELINATIEAGNEFQTLELRLNGMNLDMLIKSGEDYNTATEESIKLTKEQLEWLQKLAAITPYDNTDISNVYTLARSYGFTDSEAQKLTENTANFAAAMGLSGDALERVTMNFGQMVQRGKITSTEMRDLARGSFMPLSDILERIGTKTGKSVAEVMKEISAPGGGLPAELFIDAFNEMVAEEPRFQGAAERMAKTFKAASDNAMDVVKSVGGLQVVKPILDAVGARVAAFVSSFTDNPERWEKLVAAAKRVGEELSKIVDGLLGLLPSSESLADATVSAISGMADWLDERGPGIVKFFENLGQIVGGVADKIRIVLSLGKPKEDTGRKTPTYFPGADVATQQAQKEPEPFGEGILDAAQKIADFINNTLIPAFVKIQVWFEVNKPLIDEFWSTVWQIISDVISDITGGPKGEGGTDILSVITDFMKYVIDNKDKIVKWVEVLWSVFVVWQALTTIASIVLGIVVALATFIITIGVVPTLLAAVGAIAIVVGLALATIIPIVMGIISAWILLRNDAELLGKIIKTVVDTIKSDWDRFKANILQVVTESISALKRGDWYGVGKAIIDGVIRGLQGNVESLKRMMRTIAQDALAAAKDALGIHSPSTVFESIGALTMEGFANGIRKAAGLAVGAMQGAVVAVTAPAVSSAAGAGGDTYNNRTANLTINSSSRSENVIADFSMMESLMGA